MDLQNLSAEQENEPVRIKISIPTNAYFLSGIRNFMLDVAQNVAGFDLQWAHRLQSVVDELTNNAIEHGSNPNGEIDLIFEVEKGNSIKVTVSDDGSGKSTTIGELEEKVSAARQLGGKPTLGLRGRGFQIISNWTDEINFKKNERGGISATIQKTYRPEEREAEFVHSSRGNVLILEA